MKGTISGRAGGSDLHAEMIAIRQAAALWEAGVTDCDLYVTIKPAPMCAGAIYRRINRHIWAGSQSRLCRQFIQSVDHRFNHQAEVTEGFWRFVLPDYKGLFR